MTGIHHVTLVTAHAQENFDFYSGFLGLRLVKQTAGFEDVLQLHLFYGDGTGAPGTLVTFLVWEDGARGRTGHGQATELALAIPRDAIGFWLTRALTAGIAFTGPKTEFGEPVLRLTDPDGSAVKLVGTDAVGGAFWSGGGIPAEAAIRGIRGVQILSEQAAATEGFLERHLGYHVAGREDGLTRLVSALGDCLDLRDAAGFWPGVAGTGRIDHLAFRAADGVAVDAGVAVLVAEGFDVTPRKHRGYFASAYVREPGGMLAELATDGPGMGVDETAEALGTTVFVPDGDAQRAADIRLMLPVVARAGEPRDARAALPFVHRLWRAPDPDGTAVILLHGQGGAEADLMPLAHAMAPRADLLALRGRSTEEGVLRWFRHDAAGGFDQKDIAAEAEAFAATLEDAFAAYRLDPERTALLGYSNGANFAAAFLQLHPGVPRRAALLRPMPVLADRPEAALAGTDCLVLVGSADPMAEGGRRLAEDLAAAGATTELVALVDAGHALHPDDAAALRAWWVKALSTMPGA